MKRIGMLVAVEIDAVLNKFGSIITEKNVAGYRVFEYETDNYHMTVVNFGAGEIAAASATQYLISEHKVDLILNFGVVGGLTEAMSKTKACIVEKIVHYDFDTSAVDNVEVGRYLQYPDIYIPTTQDLMHKAIGMFPELVPVICASADKFVAEPERKIELNQKYNADICEMEAAGIALTCNRNEIPCILIKIVSDSITGGAQEFMETKDEAAAMCLEIVDRIAAEL